MAKVCSRCKKIKSLRLFGNDNRIFGGKKSRCKECEKEIKAEWRRNNQKENARRSSEYRKLNPSKVKSSLLKHWYGITIEEYNKLLERQNGKCAICKTDKPARFGRISKSFQVDHEHKTKKIRGLLCSKCNQGLGYFNDDIELLALAIRYLKHA